MANIENLASQPINIYKGNGRYVFYVDVKPRDFKEGKDPALSTGKTSVVSMNIFDSEEQKGVVAYLEPGDPKYLLEKVKANMNMKAIKKASNSNDTNLSSDMYTLVIKFGEFSGMTPAQIVSSESNREKVNALYKSLLQSAEQYPNNKKIATALCDAVKAKNAGTLSSTENYAEEIILDELKTPNNKKLDARGNTECRSLKVIYNCQVKDPYKIEISNFMAPPADGQVGAIVSKAVDKKSLSMSFSEKDFFTIADEMCEAKRLYAEATAGKRIRYAQEHSYRSE